MTFDYFSEPKGIHVAFFSNSNEVFNSIPKEILKVCDFFFVSPDESSPRIQRLKDKSLIIIDAYSLGMNFLQFILKYKQELSCPILVLDHYTEQLFINDILAKGADGYLLVHSFEEELEPAIKQLLTGESYISTLLDGYKGNTYLLK